MSPAQYVALAARPTPSIPTLSNDLFKTLLSVDHWQPVLEEGEVAPHPITGRYQAASGGVSVPVHEWVLLRNPEMRHAVKAFSQDPELLRTTFSDAWTYLMNADRFDGPDSNACESSAFCAR